MAFASALFRRCGKWLQSTEIAVTPCAAHNLKSALIGDRTVALSRACSIHRKLKMRRYAMGIAIEVNFALWIMIGCGIAEYLI
jgi:hypothetical protein